MTNEERRHTPGPWTLEIDNDQDWTISGAGGQLIMSAQGYDLMMPGNEDLPIIAAAPELLEAVIETRKLVSEAAMTGFNYADGDWAERLFMNQARLSAAIAKAEGRA